MANTIRIKRSATAGKVPTTAQLALGELAVNTNDGKLYTKKDDGTEAVVEIGAADSTGSFQLSVGTTAQRPGSPTQGMIRFNTSRGCFEGYTGSAWVNMSPLNIDQVGET